MSEERHARLEARRARRARRRRLRAQRNTIILGALLLFAAACLFFGPSQKAATWAGMAPGVPVSSAAAGPVSGSGQGAGGVSNNSAAVHLPAAPTLCNPLDPACIGDALSSWIAGQVQHALQPITDGILGNPADIVYQTPPEDSYQNRTILAINTLFIEVVDAALACLLVIGAYNVVLGHHLSLLHSSFTEVLPRALLVVCAVHFNLFFLSLFIDFENALALAVIHTASYAMLTNLIRGIFANPLTGLVTFVLVVVLAVMTLLLLVQMVTRIALVAVGLALAPLGLGCFLLPQTMR